MTQDELEDLRTQTEQAHRQTRDLRAHLSVLRDELAAVRGHATSPDGHVTAEVGMRGELISLNLDGRIYRRPDAAELADVIHRTIAAAGRDAAERVRTVNQRHAAQIDAGAAVLAAAAGAPIHREQVHREQDFGQRPTGPSRPAP